PPGGGRGRSALPDARAVGQILDGPDDVQPESVWKTVERRGDANE
ncbi:hypothetical protein IAE22_30980, partial [Bacillus sp. S34]|nr:hypothetical protein [Bacillus sp. S34]